MSLFVKKAKLNVIRIDYERLCKRPYDEFMRINAFLGTELNVSDMLLNQCLNLKIHYTTCDDSVVIRS